MKLEDFLAPSDAMLGIKAVDKTTRTRDEAVKLATVSADTPDNLRQWWK